MIRKIYHIVRTARPRQWLKNFSIFAAPFFAGTLLDGEVFLWSIRAFAAFCAVSSGAYFLNDVIDAPKDRLHPIKKNRAIASGDLSPVVALIISFLLISSSIIYSFIFLEDFFSVMLIVYVVIQLSYSFYFRNVIILDSLIVATGFIIRVFAGGFASRTSISSWLILTTIGISMLLAFGKRRSEKTILAKFSGDSKETQTRKTLRHYPDTLLDSMISMSSAYTILTYSLFTFMVSPSEVSGVLADFLPVVLKTPKLMMLTIPLVIYGIARYLYVIYEKEEGESPERVLLSDGPLLVTVLIWASITAFITFFLPGL
ncbi:decaprenyl-phosphate phosphoribosyltransferase [Patescibacteria group bacterium]|nr:decaprenyl-phosphate phosphoribosyltransferase [Patescibacteria group bacterium]